MATNHGSEERRRRILERGSDRMALITGQIKTLPTSPPAPYQSIISSSSDPPHQHHHHGDDGSNHHLRADAVVKDYTSDDTLLNKESTDEDSSGNKFVIGSQGEPQLNKGSTGIEAQEIQTTLDNGVKTIVQKTSTERDQQLPKPRRRQPRLFTSKRIHSCIVASENTRVTCSLIIAFLVVFSYVDYPLFGRNIVNSKSVVASRPLYILLLTDVTIVFARVYLEKRREFDEAEEERVALQEDGQNWEKAEKVLERGLVAYQAIRAIFIDCSVYAVVVICGLSLL